MNRLPTVTDTSQLNLIILENPKKKQKSILQRNLTNLIQIIKAVTKLRLHRVVHKKRNRYRCKN